MTNIIEKVLRSGLVDRHTAALMEKWGYLEPGSAEQVNDEALEGATKEQLQKLAEEIGDEVMKEHALRETYLDLDRLRWPATVNVVNGSKKMAIGPDRFNYVSKGIQCLVDRMGRYYFRIQDVKKEWFIPGYMIERMTSDSTAKYETILERQELHIGDQAACIQVSTVQE